MMNWSARPSLLPEGMDDRAVPAFPVDGDVLAGNSAPWLPDELPAQPEPLRHVSRSGEWGAVESDDSGDGVLHVAGSDRGHPPYGAGASGPMDVVFSERQAAEAQRLEEVRRAELDAVIETARAEGYAAGEAAGREAERRMLADAVAAAERALDTLRNADESWNGRLEENLCALAVGVARQLLSRELRQDPALVSGIVRQALIEFPIDQAVSIRINPADLAAITAQSIAGDSSSGAAAGRDARWVADSELMPGDCVVEGRERIVDGRVDTALERMYRRLAEVTQ